MISIRALSLALCLALPGAMVHAQGTDIAFGGLKQDTSQPVEVTAKTLKVDQGTGTAVFSGDVLVGQGKMRLSAAELRVTYAKDANGKTGKIQALNASGGVTLVTSPTEAAQSRDAVYTIDTGEVVMTGAVLLTQGQSVISGDRLIVNLKTGTGHMEGHVKTTLQPTAKPAAKPAAPATGVAKP